MRFTDVLSTANQNLWRNKLRSILTILAIFIGAFTIILTTGINTGVNEYIDTQMQGVGGETHLSIMPKDTMSSVMSQMGMGSNEIVEYNPEKSGSNMAVIDEDDIKAMREISGIKSADTYQMIDVEYIASAETDKKFEITINSMPTDSFDVDMASGRMVSPDAGQLQIALSPDYATKLGFESDKSVVGQKVTIGVKNSATNKISEVKATVTGVQNTSLISMGGSWINKSLATELHNKQTEGLPEQYANRAYFAVAQLEEGLTETQIQNVKDAFSELGFMAMTVEDEVGLIKSFFDAITIVLMLFGVISLIAASIGIVNTLFMSVQERTREIGLMKAMGLSPSTIRSIFNFEAIFLGFWGSLLGILVAYIISNIANNMAAESFLASLPGFTLVVLEPGNLIIFVLLVMVIAFLAGSLPANRASHLDPIEALRRE